MNRVSAILILVFLFGCIGPGLQAKLGQPFVLKEGQTAYIASENLSIELFWVAQDTRCPTDAACDFDGSLLVLVMANKANETQNVYLSYDRPGIVHSKNAFGYKIAIKDAYPHPKSNVSANLSEYSITLEVWK
ncbi:MAG: hypothetical protein MN733_07160 [Nitrososphaera sp.]|nr:hypothetical protein [Nitrososphaera sp.]